VTGEEWADPADPVASEETLLYVELDLYGEQRLAALTALADAMLDAAEEQR
jgi:hypothetical protein